MNRAALLICAATLPLAGCVSFGAKPPKSLLVLTSDAVVPIGQVRDSATARAIVVDVPGSAAALATARVPVEVTPTTLAYVKDAQWSEPPARLFARLVSDTLAARTGRVVITPVQAVGEANDQLGGTLRRFGLDATGRQAVVAYDATLSRAGQSGTETRRFEAQVPVAAIDAESAGPALNQAANQVATQIADWVGR
jgi:cholesterol transport system auxiliary component